VPRALRLLVGLTLGRISRRGFRRGRRTFREFSSVSCYLVLTPCRDIVDRVC
jgi:hypothetical protein